MHPDALSEAKSVGVDISGLRSWAEQVLSGSDGQGLWVPKSEAEAVYRLVAGEKSISIPAFTFKGMDAEDVRSILAGNPKLLAADGTELRSFATRSEGEAAAAASEGAGAADAGAGAATEGSAAGEGAAAAGEQASDAGAAGEAQAGDAGAAAAGTEQASGDAAAAGVDAPAELGNRSTD